MYSEILDDDSEDKVVHTKFVWKPRLVLGILWAIVIWRFVDGNYYSLKIFVLGRVIDKKCLINLSKKDLS
ncbi:MAG: hypothetical protein ABF294_03980 [Flavobacteriales bacterium]